MSGFGTISDPSFCSIVTDFQIRLLFISRSRKSVSSFCTQTLPTSEVSVIPKDILSTRNIPLYGFIHNCQTSRCPVTKNSPSMVAVKEQFFYLSEERVNILKVIVQFDLSNTSDFKSSHFSHTAQAVACEGCSCSHCLSHGQGSRT